MRSYSTAKSKRNQKMKLKENVGETWEYRRYSGCCESCYRDSME